MARDLLMMFGAFVLAAALAGALGAANLGTALAFGQIAFAITTVYVISGADVSRARRDAASLPQPRNMGRPSGVMER